MKKRIMISLLCVSFYVIGMQQQLKEDFTKLEALTKDVAKLKEISAQYVAQEKAIDAYLQEHEDISPIEVHFQQYSHERRQQMVRVKIITGLLVMDNNGHLIEKKMVESSLSSCVSCPS